VINFDQKGLDNHSEIALMSPASSETDRIGTHGENISADWDYVLDEELGISESMNLAPPTEEQFDILYKLTGDESYRKSFLQQDRKGAGIKYGDNPLDKNREYLASLSETIEELRKQNPDLGLKTYQEIEAEVEAGLAEKRAYLADLKARSSTNAALVGNLISTGAYFADPLMFASMFVSGGASVGRGFMGNAWRSFKIEAAVAGGAEFAITPQVYDWKQKINSPFDIQDAAIRILGASIGGGVVRGFGSLAIDAATLGKTARKLRAEGKTTEADVLDVYAELIQDIRPDSHDAHLVAYAKSQEALKEGRVLSDAEIEAIYRANGLDVPEEVIETPPVVKSVEEQVEELTVYHGGDDEFSEKLEADKDFEPLGGDEKESSTGGNRLGLSTSSSEEVAQDFAWGMGGEKVAKLYIDPEAKILDYEGRNGEFLDDLSEDELIELADGYDAVRDVNNIGGENEIRIMNPDILRDESQLFSHFKNKELHTPKPRDVSKALDEAEVAELDAIKIANAREIISSAEDTSIPHLQIADDTGETSLGARPAKEVFEELDQEEKAMTDIFACVMGAAA